MIEAVSRRTQPCDAAVPIVPPDVRDAVYCDLAGAARRTPAGRTSGRSGRGRRGLRPGLPSGGCFLDEAPAPRSRGRGGPDDGRSKERRTCPWRYTATRRSEGRRRRCQVVLDRLVLAFLIQPVLLFGRRSVPSAIAFRLVGVVADHGSTGPSFGDRTPAFSTADPRSRAAVGIRHRGSGLLKEHRQLLGARDRGVRRRAPVPRPGPGDERQRHCRNPTGCACAHPVAVLMTPAIPAGEPGGVHGR